MTDLTSLTIAEARAKLAAREISATELTDAYLAAIDAANEALNAYVMPTPDKARAMAKASDEKLAKGEGGALEGIPLGIKDLYATEGVHTQACSHVLDGFKPRYESTVTANLWADGAVMLGKLNMDEFAMGSSNENSYYGPVKNPWRAEGSNKDLVPGGSSGGSAAAVSAHLCAGATASDTGGSIRQPAAFTGTVGIKPTYGRCSRWGMVAFASSLDQAGPIARDVRDAAILLKSMASVDDKDTTSVDRPVPDYEAAVGQSVKGMKIGIPAEYRMDGMPEEIEKLWQQGIAWLKDAGAEIVDISLPHTKYALPAYYIVAPAEASSNLARYDGVRYGLRVPGKDIIEMYEKTRAAGFGDEVKRRVMIGTYVLSAGYYDAYYLKRAEGPHADQARLRDRLRRRRRRDPDAGDPVGRLRHRRPGPACRSGQDVSERHFHRDGEHGRPAGHRRSRRSRPSGPAARPAADRQAVRRGDAVPRRPCHRSRRRAGSRRRSGGRHTPGRGRIMIVSGASHLGVIDDADNLGSDAPFSGRYLNRPPARRYIVPRMLRKPLGAGSIPHLRKTRVAVTLVPCRSATCVPAALDAGFDDMSDGLSAAMAASRSDPLSRRRFLSKHSQDNVISALVLPRAWRP